MTNPEQVIRAWTNLKQKITNSWKKSDQYQLGLLLRELDYTSLAPIIDMQELKQAVNSFCIRRQAEHQRYEEELQVRLAEFTKLERKLERVRNLVADNHIEKLQRMCEKGEI